MNEINVGEGKIYQWSMFDRAHNQQYVIRTDNKDQFDELVKEYKQKLLDIPDKAFPDDEGPVAVAPSQVQPSAPICGIHKIAMNLRPAGVSKLGKPYKAFWACSQFMEDGSYCPFKPPKENV